jgi:membrane protease YdiL (CAAX protease family)
VSRWREVIALVVASLSFAAALATPGRVSIWLGTGAAAAVSGAAVAWATGGRSRALLRARRGDVAVGLAAGALLAAASHLGFRLALIGLPGLRPLVVELYEASERPGALATVAVLTLVIAVEELVWRFLAVELLAAAHLGPVAQVAGATLLYVAPLAASGSAVLVAVGATCGAVWATLRVATGGLVAPFTSHLVWAVAVLVAWPLVAA